jgi:polysaccharide export outer membrane protein
MKCNGKSILSVGVLLVLLLGSCGVNSNLMFKEQKGENKVVYITDSIPKFPQQDYTISPDDKIAFSMATQNGSTIVENISGINMEQGGSSNVGTVEYIVRSDGRVELPVIGKVFVKGLTIEQFEDTLEKRYSKDYKDPFVQARITNQRVIVFPGNGSDAVVVPLENANTTLMEALAKAGGITDRGKSSSIKVIRLVDGQRVAYAIDLSTMDGLKYVDMIVQANDYIYVEPTPELAKEIASDVVPVISLLSSAIFIISAISILK